MRYAFKLYYNGKNFSGSQIQPEQRTVEGEILRAFNKLGVKVKNFQMAGRTDHGVSALGNVFAVTTDSDLIKPRILNDALPDDIRVLGIAEVNENFNPRYEAKERIYKYFLFNEDYDIEKIKKAIKLFEGEHSFHNFCILENKNPVRKINKITIKKADDFIILTFSGESFLWQMIRRIVTALKMIGNRELTIKELRRYFDSDCNNKIPPSEAESLVLWDLKYAFDFKLEGYSIKKFLTEIFEKQKELETEALINEEILRELSKS
jgi:tRNA pseudouridine38-40 synthase